MVRFVCVGPGPRALCPPESLAALRAADVRLHADPSHSSFEWLAEEGVSAIGPEGAAPDGSVVAIPAGSTFALENLVAVVDRLLGPGGCPWDREQTHETLKRHLIEEAYELIEAIDSGDRDRLIEEIGDVLLQPLMHAQIRKAAGDFDIEAVVQRLVEKLVRRHPHVFADAVAGSAEQVLDTWDTIKGQEKTGASRLTGVPRSMPALLRAHEISVRAARSGFEWPSFESVFDKLREEERELRDAVEGGDAERIEQEVGDLLFTAVNIARWARVEPEDALRKMLNRFAARFMAMEQAAGDRLTELTPQEWDTLWEQSKREEQCASS